MDIIEIDSTDSEDDFEIGSVSSEKSFTDGIMDKWGHNSQGMSNQNSDASAKFPTHSSDNNDCGTSMPQSTAGSTSFTKTSGASTGNHVRSNGIGEVRLSDHERLVDTGRKLDVMDGHNLHENLYNVVPKRSLPASFLSSVNRTAPKGSSDVKDRSQIYNKEKMHASIRPDYDGMMNVALKRNGETDTSKNGHRILPSSFAGGDAVDALAKFQPPTFVDEKFHNMPKASVESRDALHILGNVITNRMLPSTLLYGKSVNNLQPPGTSDGQKHLGLVDDRRIEHDERHIYQEALQNLGQPRLEDDLPEGLLAVPLLKHQKIALAWMVQKEKSTHCAGGILADDQGLGKTISMIALIQKQMLILDEAQTIKNHRTQVARACCGLRAKRRWCLSGTPMQNAIDDLYSYFRFLKYDPYSVYSSFCASIKYPISKNTSSGYRKLQAVLKAVLLRRTKGTLIDGEPILKLPPKSICLKKVDFSHEEREFYLKLEADSRQQFKDPPEDAVVAMCGHVFCYQCISERLTGDENLCPAPGCRDVLGTESIFSRSTLKSCISDNFDDEASTSCSFDDGSIVHSGYISSKIRAALDILKSISCPSSEVHNLMICGSKSDANSSDHISTLLNSNADMPAKAIVFSQWTSMLDLLELSLNECLIQYRRLDGTMSLMLRDKAVKDFNTDPEVTVMLMSLKAGSLGLNMVAACHVILLDLWWNPTTEDQAIDRAHRIGQTRPVTVSRITIKDTVEDRILALQEEKRKMVSTAFGEDQTSSHATRLTVEDLRRLFNCFDD
uniref:Helicase C-terminal domain-containing protein n=1 Tax=Musa acuminata subsp. malaccensis TaxID=214687 RepID=A0A804J5E0_MUSAM